MKGFAEELRDFEEKCHALGELAQDTRLSIAKQNAVLLAIKAVHFACNAKRSNEFNLYLLEWPGKMTPEIEARIKELEDES